MADSGVPVSPLNAGGSAQMRGGDYNNLDILSQPNPFKLPTDDQVFLLRDQERRKKEKRREELNQLKVWEKASATSRFTASAKRMLNEYDGSEGKLDEGGEHKQGGSGGGASGLIRAPPKRVDQNLIAAATAAILKDRRHEKENMSDFIAKKREMFLVQMSLDTKHEEIRKLEEKAQMKEEALKKSELMLEEDAIRFDTFLKENDKKAHEAIKRAEVETKKKQEKVQEIKRLTMQITQVQAEMSKSTDVLQHCLLYKNFLESLTPSEWFAQRTEEKEKKKRFDKAAKLAQLTETTEEVESAAGASGGKSKQQASGETTRGSARRDEEKSDTGSARKPNSREGKEAKEDLVGDVKGVDGESEEDDDDDDGMYFSKPHQLLAIFTQLEESNLFLIQNSQETEQALEELKQELRETENRMEEKTEVLQKNIKDLETQIAHEEKKAETLRERLQNRRGEDAQEGLLTQLHGRVQDVYKRCSFDVDASPSTLIMLTDLEAKLEDLLSQIEQMPEEYVVKAEKSKEKERRERVRAERMAQQQKIYEERLRKSMERSMQAPKKKTGKPVMFRSAPPQKKKKKKKDEHQSNEEDRTAEFFTW